VPPIRASIPRTCSRCSPARPPSPAPVRDRYSPIVVQQLAFLSASGSDYGQQPSGAETGLIDLVERRAPLRRA